MLSGPLRILLVTAKPDDQHWFHAGRKTRALKQWLAPLIDHGLASLDIETATRADQLQQLLQFHRPTVLHIVCHGVRASREGKRALAFEGRRGERAEIDAGALHRIIVDSGAPVELVVLEACKSEALARELISLPTDREIITSVVGTREKVKDRASTRFFLSFHQVLAAEHDVRHAFDEAMRDLELLAPELWGVPMLVDKASCQTSTRRRPPPGLLLNVQDRRRQEYVHLASVHHPPELFIGREPRLRELDRLWFSDQDKDRVSIVHLHGAAGIGKTALLSRWLARHASRSYCGATRVFSWSFDTQARGPGVGTIAEFLDHALDFFEGIDPAFRLQRGNAGERRERLDGMRLARLVRRQRALLCLDDVPLLPHTRGSGPYSPIEVFPPGIVALLQELAQGQDGLCIVTTRLDGELVCPLRIQTSAHLSSQDRPLINMELGALQADDEQAPFELLIRRGVVCGKEELDRISTALGHHPLSLEVSASVLLSHDRPGVVFERLADHRTLAQALGELGGEETKTLLAALSLRDGSLSFTELLSLVDNQTPSPGGTAPGIEFASWDALPDRWLHALRWLRRFGLIHTTLKHDVVLHHLALLEPATPEDPRAFHELFAVVAAALPPRLESAGDVPAFARAIRLGVRADRVNAAVEIYSRGVCHRDDGGRRYEQGYLSRQLGLIADDLRLLGEFFEPASCVLFSQLREGVAEAPAVSPGGAFLFHRAGLCLRHLGRLREARAPLEQAFHAYHDEVQTFQELAATCANDLAELEASLGELDKALDWARRAVQIADAFKRSVKPNDGRYDRAFLAQFLGHATLGHINDQRARLGIDPEGWETARQAFAVARQAVAEFNRDSSEYLRHLFSRPGYQYWHFLHGILSRSSSPETQGELQELAEHLYRAPKWFQTVGNVAHATQAYEKLARGRLLTLCAERKLEVPEVLRESLNVKDDPARAALEELFSAVHILRANQYLWMLPEALQARATLYALLEDPLSAARDREEAGLLHLAITGKALPTAADPGSVPPA